MTREGWARALLGRLGYRATTSNVRAVLAWMRAEGGHWNNSASFNPLNTTQGMSGARSMNSVGVKAYRSWEQGLQATVITLRNGYYGRILSAFRGGGSARNVANAVVSSPWGTKHISVSGISVTGGGGGFTGSPVKAKLDREELAEQYGMSARMINSNPELRRIFSQAVSGGWSVPKFQAKVKNTGWWRRHSTSQRKYINLRQTDPATWRQKWDAAAYKANSLAVAAGVGSLLGKGTKLGRMKNLLERATYNLFALGWSEARLKDWFGARATLHDGVMWGEAGEAFDKMHEVAYLNGMRYSSSWYKKHSQEVAGGRTTIDNIQDRIRRQAAARFSAFAEQIKAGQNAMDLAAPYIKTVSELLEKPETDVDLFNKHVYNAMHGSHAGANYPLWQFENDVRSDPLWKKTKNARESTFQVAHQVAKDFGMAY